MAHEGSVIQTGRKNASRRRQILNAAFVCFIRHGYAKVTVNDVAKAAGISRPLVYLLFSSKEEIFTAMFSSLFDDQLERAAAVSTSSREPRRKIARVIEIVFLEMWSELKTAPEDLLDAAERLFPKIGAKYRNRVAAILGDILGDRELGELLVLSVKGLSYDRPSTGVLRKRATVLIDRFFAVPRPDSAV